MQIAHRDQASASAPLSDELAFDPKILLTNQQRFYDQSTLQKATAGTHHCALCDGNDLLKTTVNAESTLENVI